MFNRGIFFARGSGQSQRADTNDDGGRIPPRPPRQKLSEPLRRSPDVYELLEAMSQPPAAAAACLLPEGLGARAGIVPADGFVTLDSRGKVVGGLPPGARSVRRVFAPEALSWILARGNPTALEFVLPDERSTCLLRHTLPSGRLRLSIADLEHIPLAHYAAGKPWSIVPVGVFNGAGSEVLANLLVLPRDYDGPVLIADLDHTTRDTHYRDIARGATAPPLQDALAFLRGVAERDIPILYVSFGSDQIHLANAKFLRQLPEGVLIDRPGSLSAALLATHSMRTRRQARYKAAVVGMIRFALPNARLFGLGDNHYGDAIGYSRQPMRSLIRTVKSGPTAFPPDFRGIAAPHFGPNVLDRALRQLDRAQLRSRSFGGHERPRARAVAFHAILDQLSGADAIPGNRVELFVDGDEARPALLRGVREAQELFCFDLYQLQPKDEAAQELTRELEATAQRAQVVGTVDSWGSKHRVRKRVNACVERLRVAGAEVMVFRPFNGVVSGLLEGIRLERNHRKLYAADGKVAFVTDMNAADVYLGDADTPHRERGSMVRIDGPAARAVQRAIEDAHVRSGGKAFPALPATPPFSDGIPVRVVTHVPREDQNIEASLLAMVSVANESIYTRNPYPPSEELMDAFIAAAHRRCRVVYITGKPTELVRRVTRFRLEALLDAGGEVYVEPTGVHGKEWAFDRALFGVGSANHDLVTQHNWEVTVFFEDPRFTEHGIQRIFEEPIHGVGRSAPLRRLSRGDLPRLERLTDSVLARLWPTRWE